MGLEPGWGCHGEPIQRVAHGLADEFEAMQRPDGSEDMGGIGPLRPPRFEEVVGLQLL